MADAVIITRYYPFGVRADFIEDEIPFLADAFDHVYILSLSENMNLRKDLFIPNNFKIYSVRDHKKLKSIALSVFQIMSPRLWNEVRFGKKTNSESFKKIIRSILIFHVFDNQISDIINTLDLDINQTVFYSYWLTMGAFSIARLRKKNKIMHAVSRAHGFDCFVERGYIPYRREMIEGLERIYSISEAGKASLDSNIVPKIKNNRKATISVSRLGIIKGPELNPENRNEFFTIVTCSNVIPLKRIDLFIKALSKIENTKIEWFHFGDGSEMTSIKELAKCLLKENIKYTFWGRVPKSQILDFYSEYHIDLFVNCSELEGVPVSIMEAFAFGIPVVATDVGGTSEIFKPGAGILVSENTTPESLANAINEILQMDDNNRKRMRETAYICFKEYSDANRNYKEFVKELNSLIDVNRS